MSESEDVTARFYVHRTKPWHGHIMIIDGRGGFRERLAVHEDDVDFVCAALNAADRRERLCTV